MKKVTTRLSVISAVALLTLWAGCATNKQTEDLLTAAGFKAVPATTPEQQTHLKTLAAHQITQTTRDGKPFFVYPDASKNVLYVGQEAQYQQYQKLRAERQLAAEKFNVSAENTDANWAAWGGWRSTW